MDEQGKAVPGTRVLATTGDAFNRVVADSAYTDAGGKFRLRGLRAGAYNVEGDYRDGALVSFVPWVPYADSAKDIGTDTLRAPGSISGTMLHQGSPVPGIACYLSGTYHSAVSDSAGRFRMHRIPQRTYLLIYYASSPYHVALDTPVVVLSGRHTELPPKNLERD